MNVTTTVALAALIEPGRACEYRIDCWNTCQVFNKGHRIRIEVTSSAFPAHDVNPNTGGPLGKTDGGVRATQRILHDRRHPSHVILPFLSAIQTVRATRLAMRDRQPALQGRCSTLSGLTSSDHPDPRGLHPGLFYSTLSASSVSIAAGICEASPPPASQWAERNGHSQSPRAVRRSRPRRGSNRSARGANPGMTESAARPNPEGVGRRSPDETTSLQSPLSESQ